MFARAINVPKQTSEVLLRRNLAYHWMVDRDWTLWLWLRVHMCNTCKLQSEKPNGTARENDWVKHNDWKSVVLRDTLERRFKE
jgi:hypothetical protein